MGNTETTYMSSESMAMGNDYNYTTDDNLIISKGVACNSSYCPYEIEKCKKQEEQIK